MNNLSLILRILAIVAALVASALFFVGKGKLAEQKAAQVKAEEATKAVQAELKTANQQIDTLQTQLKSESEALANEKRNLENARSELFAAREKTMLTEQKLNEATSRADELDNTAKNLRRDLLESEQKLAAARTRKEAEIAQLNTRIAELEKSNTELEKSLQRAKERDRGMTAMGSSNSGISNTYGSNFNPVESEEFPSASVGSETTIQSLSTKDGLIVFENRAGLGLIPGNEATVVRDLKALARVKVIQVTDDSVVANILPATSPQRANPLQGAKSRKAIILSGTKPQAGKLTEGSTIRLLR